MPREPLPSSVMTSSACLVGCVIAVRSVVAVEGIVVKSASARMCENRLQRQLYTRLKQPCQAAGGNATGHIQRIYIYVDARSSHFSSPTLHSRSYTSTGSVAPSKGRSPCQDYRHMSSHGNTRHTRRRSALLSATGSTDS